MTKSLEIHLGDEGLENLVRELRALCGEDEERMAGSLSRVTGFGTPYCRHLIRAVHDEEIAQQLESSRY